VVAEESVALFGGAGEPSGVKARLEGLRLQADLIRNGDASKGSPTGKAHDLENLEERIRNLSTITATISVGGGSDVELLERWQRIENAKNAISAALAEGGLPGGGVGLLRCRKALRSLTSDDLDIRYGIAIIADAVAEPVRLISGNAGKDADAVISSILASEDDFWGLDVRTGAFGDLYELGVIDSLRVTRLVLQHAVSTASTLMTTECIIAEVPPADPSFGYTAEWAAATREDPRQ
jgi:chaperonin GroEL